MICNAILRYKVMKKNIPGYTYFFTESGAKGTARGVYGCAIIRRRVPFVRYKSSLTISLKMFKKT